MAAALERAGFVDITLTDRNAWYRGIAREEHAALVGPLHARLVRELGAEFVRHYADVWAALAAGKPHEVLPLVGVTHMTPQEVVAENLLLHQLEFLRRSLGLH